MGVRNCQAKSRPMPSRPYGAARCSSAQPVGRVYALDARTGCQRWVFDAGFGVRTAVTIGEDARGTTASFGDQRGIAYALDAETGKLLWKQRVDDHQGAIITGAPTLADGVLYVPVSSAGRGAGD